MKTKNTTIQQIINRCRSETIPKPIKTIPLPLKKTSKIIIMKTNKTTKTTTKGQSRKNVLNILTDKFMKIGKIGKIDRICQIGEKAKNIAQPKSKTRTNKFCKGNWFEIWKSHAKGKLPVVPLAVKAMLILLATILAVPLPDVSAQDKSKTILLDGSQYIDGKKSLQYNNELITDVECVDEDNGIYKVNIKFTLTEFAHDEDHFFRPVFYNLSLTNSFPMPENNIINQVVRPGETIEGYVIINTFNFSETEPSFFIYCKQ